MIIVGGEIDGVHQNGTTLHVLPDARSICQQPSAYPFAVSGPVGVVIDKGLTVCGGLVKTFDVNSSEEVLQTRSDCYKLTGSGWSRIDELKHSRAFAASTFLPGRGWWITGGVNYDNQDLFGLESPLSSTELIPIEDDERADEYKFLVDEPNLPQETGLSHHCLVRLDKHRVLLIGGQTTSNKFVSSVWLFDWKRRKWDEWEDLQYGRHSHSCSLALGGEFVIVVGGRTEHESSEEGGSQLAEIMEITSGHWHIMPHLPKPIWGGVFVQIKDFLSLIGGASNDESLTIQLLEKGEFLQTKLKFNPELIHENKRKYALTILTQEKYVCF